MIALHALPFVVTFTVCLVLIWTQRWHGHLRIDRVFGAQKKHTAPTQRVGGVVIASGLAAVACGVAPQPGAGHTGADAAGVGEHQSRQRSGATDRA